MVLQYKHFHTKHKGTHFHKRSTIIDKIMYWPSHHESGDINTTLLPIDWLSRERLSIEMLIINNIIT